MIEERKSTTINQNIVQNIVLENREKLNVSGVNDVLSFDDQVVMIDTELGLLTVKGENIRINVFLNALKKSNNTPNPIPVNEKTINKYV